MCMIDAMARWPRLNAASSRCVGHRGGVARSRVGLVTLGVVLALLLPASQHLAGQASRQTPDGPSLLVVDASRSMPGPVFRLGTAARPFSFSTVVGDLNADGIPDVVVADRTATALGGRQFRLDFSISGQPSNFTTFQSNDDVVTVGGADVDHDSDLDIVVADPISGRTVRIWLNDGFGHFKPASVERFAKVILPTRIIGDDRSPVVPDQVAVAPRRDNHSIPVLVSFAASSASSRPIGADHARFSPRSASFQLAPRAPPASQIAVRS